MAGLFSHNSSPDYRLDEGTVFQVDHIRLLCKVKTLQGRALHSVQCLTPYGGSGQASDRFLPNVGDRVVLSYGLGYPLIIGFLPRLQNSESNYATPIESGDVLLDTGNYAPNGNAVVADQNKPGDMLQGDRILSTPSGNVLALLRAGTNLLRSSRAAEVMTSRLFSLVRVVSRRWEHFTDVSSEVVRNVSGRVFRYSGYAKTFAEAKTEAYKYEVLIGDVAVAEALKTGVETTLTTTPVLTPVLFKEIVRKAVSGGSPALVMYRTLDDLGQEEVYITDGSQFCKMNMTAGLIEMTWNGQNTVHINPTEVKAWHKDGATLVLDQNGVHASFNAGTVDILSDKVRSVKGQSSCTLQDSSLAAANGGSSVTLTNASSEMLTGNSKVTLTSSEARLSSSGHQISVTSGGIAVS